MNRYENTIKKMKNTFFESKSGIKILIQFPATDGPG